MYLSRRFSTFASAVLVTLLAACRGKESAASQAGASAAATPAPAAANTTATTAAAGPTALADPNIVYLLDQANAADSARGALAEQKGTSPAVKAFARLMMGEHHALRQEGQALAKKLRLTPIMPPGDQSEAQAKEELDSLTAMPNGSAWDRAYMEYENTYHQGVLRIATTAASTTQNAELKALLQKAAPVIQRHLLRAREIQQKLT
jgi:putative membrane protein